MIAGQGFGRFAAAGGMDEPDVADGVGAIGGLAISVALGGGFAVGHAEGGADLELGVDGFDGAEGLTLSHVDDVGGAHALGEILARRRVSAPAVAEKGEDPRLIENAPVRDAIAESPPGDVNIVGDARGEIAIRPAAGAVQSMRKIPMLESAYRT